MTNSKIRNFFETLRSIKEDALLPYIHLSENQMRSLNCRQTIYLSFEHYILSVRMFIFVLTIDCVIYKSEFLARDTVLYTQIEASFVFLLRKAKKN